MNVNQTVVVPSALLDTTLQFVDVASQTTKKALDEVELHRQAQKRAADLRPQLLDYMVTSGVVNSNQKQAADAMLGSHAETMQLLKAAIDKIVELKQHTKSAGDVGEAVTPEEAGVAAGGSYTKQGEFNSLTNPVVGLKTSFVKESDKPLLALIGK